MQPVHILNQSRPSVAPLTVGYCDSFWGRLRGLMFRRSIGEHEGLLMVQPHSSKMDAAIHMFFMNFDIAVVWADSHLRVVDVRLARRWHPGYAPVKAAKYVLETHQLRLNDYQINDQLVLRNV